MCLTNILLSILNVIFTLQMEWIRNYLQKKQDQSSVSYSRFGRPGEEEEERPPPTQIVVAPFDENDPQFKLFGYWHIERASAVSLKMFLSDIQ